MFCKNFTITLYNIIKYFLNLQMQKVIPLEFIHQFLLKFYYIKKKNIK